MKKNSLTKKLGDVRWSSDNFIIPTVGQITTARIASKYDENRNIVSGSIAKINLEIVNYKTLQTVLKDGGDISDLATITVELIADEAIMKRYKVEDLIGKLIDLREVEVALKWVSRGNSGSWNGFKLITDNLKFVTVSNAKVTE